MKTINLGLSGLEVPVIAVGCMRINGISKAEAERFVKSALDMGANFFDHADVYGGGACESIFAVPSASSVPPPRPFSPRRFSGQIERLRAFAKKDRVPIVVFSALNILFLLVVQPMIHYFRTF